MLPDQYAEGDDRYGGGGYADERYGTGDDVGEERYGGGVAGGDRYGVEALLYGDADDGYAAMVGVDSRYAVPAGSVGYDAAVDGRYVDGVSVGAPFAVELPEEWSVGSDWTYN